MAEQAESVDNPMHEAAKRGATATDKMSVVHALFIYCDVSLFPCNSSFIRDSSVLLETTFFFFLNHLHLCVYFNR